MNGGANQEKDTLSSCSKSVSCACILFSDHTGRCAWAHTFSFSLRPTTKTGGSSSHRYSIHNLLLIAINHPGTHHWGSTTNFYKHNPYHSKTLHLSWLLQGRHAGPLTSGPHTWATQRCGFIHSGIDDVRQLARHLSHLHRGQDMAWI